MTVKLTMKRSERIHNDNQTLPSMGSVLEATTRSAHLDDELALPSALNAVRGRRPIHRALYHISFPRSRLIQILLVPLIFNVITWLSREPISAGWQAFSKFWVKTLELRGTVTLKPVGYGLNMVFPYLELPSRSPDVSLWWGTFVLTLAVMLGAPLIPGIFLPIQYFVRFAAFIQITALMFFAIFPATPLFTIADYLEGSFITGMWLMLVVPWMHALTYYIFDFSIWQKTWLTLLTLIFINVALPFQLMTHMYLLVKFSLLFLPVLHLLFGIFLHILVCVALYGWAMSWEAPARRPR